MLLHEFAGLPESVAPVMYSRVMPGMILVMPWGELNVIVLPEHEVTATVIGY